MIQCDVGLCTGEAILFYLMGSTGVKRVGSRCCKHPFQPFPWSRDHVKEITREEFIIAEVTTS